MHPERSAHTLQCPPIAIVHYQQGRIDPSGGEGIPVARNTRNSGLDIAHRFAPLQYITTIH